MLMKHPPGLHLWSGQTAESSSWELHRGDATTLLKGLPSSSYQCAVTSPPYYWQRDYKVEGQLGLESSIAEYVRSLTTCFRELRRVLKKDGVFFLNLGDTYYSAKGMPRGNDKKSRARRFGLRAVDASGLGVPRKTILGMPWRVALSMIEDGWILRSPIVWERPSSLPEGSSKDRPWRTHEMLFMFSKSPRYFFNRAELDGQEDVWRLNGRAQGSKGLHSAAFPESLVDRCIRVGTKEGDSVIDPFAGTGTTLATALKLKRDALGIDLSHEYCEFAAQRLGQV